MTLSIELPAAQAERLPQEAQRLRLAPEELPPLGSPGRFETRYVSTNGGIRWNSRWVNVSTVCAGEYVGPEEIADGISSVYFGPLRLGRIHERHMRIEDEYGRPTHVPGLFCYLCPRPLRHALKQLSSF